MEIDLRNIYLEADVHDVQKAVALVLHGPELYDPNDKRNNGQKSDFEVVMGTSPAGRTHVGTAILRVTADAGYRLLQWYQRSDENNIVVHGQALQIFNAHRKVPLDKKETPAEAGRMEIDLYRSLTLIENQTRLVRLIQLRIAFLT
jgi:RNA-dependent RNA polymerase